MNFISDLMLILIAFVGIGFLTSGKPKRKTDVIRNISGDCYFYRKDNFTKKIIKILVFIVILYFLGNSIK